MKQFGEIVRRRAFWALDALQGGKQRKLLEKSEHAMTYGIYPEAARKKVDRILKYATKYSAFYKPYEGLTELTQFPVMNKMIYNENYQEILVPDYKEGGKPTYKLSTSGSTGTPLTVLCDGGKMRRINMNFMTVMEMNGFRLGMKRGEFRVWIEGKNTRSWFTLTKTNLVMIDISNMGEDRLQEICDLIQKKRIQVLVSYSSAMTALGKYIKEHQIDVSKWAVEMIFTMGEALSEDTEQLLTELFGFHPIRSYGNNENGFIAVQLNNEPNYTIDLENYYIEILKLDSDEAAAPGELGRIVVTDYYNKAFPMIRYDTGDTGKMIEILDEKGRKKAKFTEIYGRRGSMLYNCKGEPLSIHVFMNVLINLEGIVHQAQCIQVEKTRYRLLLNADREKINEAEVVGLYRRYLGDEAVIEVEYVDEIPVVASGKRLVCLQECPDYK